MANYKLNYSGEKIDELLTKIDNLGTGTDTKSGTVKLSSATDSNSGVSDGVAATPSAVSQLKTYMDAKANKSDVLSLEEIQASTDLSGKIASASAIRELNTAIANSGLKMDLLWTNASPKSAFANQTISLDSSKYNFLNFEFHTANASNMYEQVPTVNLIVENKPNNFRVSGVHNSICSREFSIDGNSIIFGDGKNISIYNSVTLTTENDLMVPYKIYGIK